MSRRAEHPSAVLFDLDGTLLDTAPDLIGALNAVRADHGRPAVAVDGFRRWVSQGGRRLLKEGFPELDEVGVEKLLPSFLAHYANNIAAHTRVYPGVLEMLARLEDEQVPWAIVTNKPIGLTRQLLHSIGWAERTAVVVGGDSLAERKPHPLPLQHALASLGASNERAWMVGDDRRDIDAGKRAKCRTLIARWGYLDDPDGVNGWGADGIVERAQELLPWWFGLESEPVKRAPA